MAEVFDTCVVGAGVVGSSSARYLASCGKRTLLLEQFSLPHCRGSSHGQGRTIRYAYNCDIYAQMMPEAFKMWREIEKMEDTELIVENGALSIHEDPQETKKLEKVLKKMNIRHKLFGPRALKEAYPMLQFGDNFTAVLDQQAGTIRSDKSLRYLQNQFVKFGGILHDSEKVEEIIPGSVIVVKTNKAEYRTRSLVITPGAWASPILKQLGLDLPLEPVKIDVCYWKVQEPGIFSAVKGSPNFFFQFLKEPDVTEAYALSCLEYPQLLKICNHIGTAVDPEARDKDSNKEKIIKFSDFVGRHFVGIESTPSIVETCLYTVTPDEDFIIDRHPNFKNIVIGAGFSGHGFKMAPVTGKILAQLANGEKIDHDIEMFRLSRFKTPKAAL